VIRAGETERSYPRELPGGLVIYLREHMDCPEWIYD